MRALEPLRCPYCVEGEVPRFMTARADGEWFICVRCGHAAMPAHPSYRCTCQNCVSSMRPPSPVS